MTQFLNHIITRHFSQVESVKPRLPARFEAPFSQAETIFSDQDNKNPIISRGIERENIDTEPGKETSVNPLMEKNNEHRKTGNQKIEKLIHHVPHVDNDEEKPDKKFNPDFHERTLSPGDEQGSLLVITEGNLVDNLNIADKKKAPHQSSGAEVPYADQAGSNRNKRSAELINENFLLGTLNRTVGGQNFYKHVISPADKEFDNKLAESISSSSSQTIVKVSIGRIDVRANQVSKPSVSTGSKNIQPKISLEDYLKGKKVHGS